MKLKLLLMAIPVSLLLLVLASGVLAQGEPPAPYAGLKNPFPWGDTSAQQVGKGIYQRSCAGCHGATGSSLAVANFSASDFPQSLEKRADFYFWVLSEGALSKGMPPYKSSLAGEQRWQVLTYIWSLGSAKAPPPATPSTEIKEGTLLLTAPENAAAGKLLTLSALLKDNQGQPVPGATVKFFIRADFFTTGLMEIGEAETGSDGVAVLEYTPRETGATQIVARYGTIETTATVTLAEANRPFYQAEAGLRLPAPGPELLIGPQSALYLGELGAAPTSALRLPGGTLSWLWLFVGVVLLVWVTYFRVIYQVFRIPIATETGETNARLIPIIGLTVIVMLGTLLLLFVLTGPNSNLNFLR